MPARGCLFLTMALIFWISVALLVYSYIGYPLLLILLAPFLGKRVSKSDFKPSVSLVIAAYNEEQIIAAKIENSLGLDYPREKLEIVIASESTDKTDAIVEAYRGRGVKLLHYSRRGKPAMLFATVPELHGEILVFSDANAMYENDAITKLVRNFADSRIGCVSGQLKYRDSLQSAGANESLYWRYEMWVKAKESRLFRLLGANGSIFAIRKSLYEPINPEQGDDFEISVQILITGNGAVLEPEAVSWEEPSALVRQEFRRRVRNVGWAFPSARLLLERAIFRPAPLVALQLLSHKFLRWLIFPLLIGTLITSGLLSGSVYAGLFILQLVFYLLAAVGWILDLTTEKSPTLLRVPYYFCVLHWGAIRGIAKGLASTRHSMWDKVR